MEYPGLRFYWPAILEAANGYNLDPWIVAGIICVESGANADFFQHDRNVWNRYLKKLPEWAAQNPRRVASRYGLMGLSFLNALAAGLPKGDPPEVLFMPAVSLEFGCRRLQSLTPRCPDTTVLLASYHGGFQHPVRPDGARYAAEVLQMIEALKHAARE